MITTCPTRNYSTFFIPLSLNTFQAIYFQNLSIATRSYLENYDLAAQLATLDAVTEGTIAKQACYWGYWQT
jgi:hypothetical protein